MNPTTPRRPDLAPTSPHPPGRPRSVTSPLAPLPYGGELTRIATAQLHNDPLHLAPRGDLNTTPPSRTCRTCGCTDDAACWPTCWWVAPDLCSAC